MGKEEKGGKGGRGEKRGKEEGGKRWERRKREEERGKEEGERRKRKGFFYKLNTKDYKLKTIS